MRWNKNRSGPYETFNTVVAPSDVFIVKYNANLEI